MSSKKKRGSSLIAVLLIFAVLSISGLSILALTVADYNARLTASKKVQSLYASDSGVNAVYGIMKKITLQATQKGNNDVNDYMKTFDGSLDADHLKTKLNDIFKQSYQQTISNYIVSNIASPHEYLRDGTCKDLEGNTISLYDSGDTNHPDITVTQNLEGSTPLIADKWEFNITSKFFTSPINGQTSNKKTVTANIVLTNEDYQGSYSVSDASQDISINPVWQNAISIDGDMKINSNIIVNGNVFVKGNTPVVDTEKVYSKYNGGITIGSDDTNAIIADFNNNVVTANSFNINGQNKTVTASNIYAGNVNVGKSSNSVQTDSSNCTLSVQDTNGVNGMVYTDNDLSLYATNSQINIDKYYGINGIGLNGEKRAVDKDYNSSSSIVVNANDIGLLGGSSINIGDAIINGTANINTATPYETGESVAIKGNYRAYTVPIPKSTETPYGEDKVDFVYNKPLQLVNNFKNSDTSLTYAQKAEYFRKVYDLYPKGLKKDGINIANLISSAGVTVANGGIKPVANDNSLIQSKQNEFAKMVYEMGDETHLGVSANADNSPTTLNNVYAQGKVNKTVFDGVSSGYQTNTIAQVTLNGVTDSKNIDTNKSEVEVRTKSKNVVILGQNSTYVPQDNDEVVDLTKMNNTDGTHGIIITSGNVTLSGIVNFTGTIIAGGNLTTMNDGLKKLTYDDSYVKKTIASDYDNTYAKVFNQSTKTSTETVKVGTTFGKISNESNTITNKLVKLNNWRVSN